MLFGGILSYLYYVSFSYTLFCWLFWFLFSFPVIIHVHTWFCIYNFYYFPYRSPPMYTSLRAHKTWICCGLRSGTDSHSGDHTRTPVPPALPWVSPCTPHQHSTHYRCHCSQAAAPLLGPAGSSHRHVPGGMSLQSPHPPAHSPVQFSDGSRWSHTFSFAPQHHQDKRVWHSRPLWV